MPLGFVDGFIVEIGEDGESVVVALDGSGDTFSPTRVVTVEEDQQSGNIRHELINGGIAMALVASRPPEGTIQFLFTSDASADAARAILARPTVFQLTVPQRPTLNMTFARLGALSPVAHNTLENTWMVRVGYQEIE